MRPRTLARRLAFQYTFQYDLNGGDCEAIEDFLFDHTDEPEIAAFSKKLIKNYIDRKPEVDQAIVKLAHNYKFDRIGMVEKSVLRLALAELQADDTPVNVVIDEALKIAKKFGNKDSHKFINGILDAAAKETSNE
jgi:N utilization substance protein B